MARIFTIAVALLCILCVLVLCIAPSVDIPETTLKSLQIIAMLMLTLAASAFLLAARMRPAFSLCAFRTEQMAQWIPSQLPPIEASCVQQC